MQVQRPVAPKRRPLVSVVIPHYNYGQYLPTSVGSVLSQPGVDLEVIIVDDTSSDGSLEVARGIAASDDRITLVEHEQNMRHIRTYNDGLSRATGDYVVLLSADDALSPRSLLRSVALMEANPEVGLTYGRVAWFDGDLPEFPPVRSWWQVWSGQEWIGRLARRGRNAIANPEVVMRRSVYDDIGGYDPDFPHAADMFMWLEAAARSDIGFVGGPHQAFYRNHGANMHSTDFGGVLDDMTQVRDVYRRFFAGSGAALAGASRLQRIADDAVAREALLRGALLAAEGAPPETLAAFRSFAAETSPRAPRTPTHAWSGWAGSGRDSRTRMVRAVEDVRWRLRWRRTSYFGM